MFGQFRVQTKMETISMLKRFLNAALAIVALLMVGGSVSKTLADAGGVDKTAICHANSSGSYSFLELPPEPLSAHFDEFGSPNAGHEKGFFSVDGDCDKSNDPGGDPNPQSTTPEPVTILLFGAGVAGVGYASRKLRRNKKVGSDT
jgi:hypothetical protein